MAQIALRDLKNKPHNLTLKDGSVLRIKPRERVLVDEKLLSNVIFAEIKRGYLGYSKVAMTASPPKITQTTTYKSPENKEGEDSAKADTESSNNTKSAKKNK